jgi:hypothetical protein
MYELKRSILKSGIKFYGKHIIPVEKRMTMPFELGDTLETLEAKGVDVSNITQGTVVYDEEKGISWGLVDRISPDDSMTIDVPEWAGSMRIVWSGGYNNPSGGLGRLNIDSVADGSSENLFRARDSWTSNYNGHYLVINEDTVFSKYNHVNYVNREDVVMLGGVKKLKISMGGYGGYPYTRRFIKEIKFLEKPSSYSDILIDGIQSFWPLVGNYENVGTYRDMIPHGSIELSEDGARLHTGSYLEFYTRNISKGFAYLIDIEVYDDHDPADYIHFMCEYGTQYNFSFKMTSPNASYPMKPYVYKYYRQHVTSSPNPIVSYGEKRVMAITSDGSRIKMYVDGVLIDEKSFSYSITYTHFRIGDWNGEGFSGMVRSAALYSRDLSDEEITSVTQAMISNRAAE